MHNILSGKMFLVGFMHVRIPNLIKIENSLEDYLYFACFKSKLILSVLKSLTHSLPQFFYKLWWHCKYINKIKSLSQEKRNQF